MKPIQWFAGSPLADALHGYDTDVAARALHDLPPHPAPKEETAMTATQHSPHPQQLPAPSLAIKVERLEKDLNDTDDLVLTHESAIKDLQSAIKDLQEANRSLWDRVQALTERLDALPQPKTRERDDTNDRIIAYLRDSVPGVWMTPGTVAANMKLDGKSVASRLDRLAGLENAVVERTGGRGSGAHPLYRVVPPPRPAQPEERS